MNTFTFTDKELDQLQSLVRSRLHDAILRHWKPEAALLRGLQEKIGKRTPEMGPGQNDGA
jgi:hypothetical protein